MMDDAARWITNSYISFFGSRPSVCMKKALRNGVLLQLRKDVCRFPLQFHNSDIGFVVERKGPRYWNFGFATSKEQFLSLHFIENMRSGYQVGSFIEKHEKPCADWLGEAQRMRFS